MLLFVYAKISKHHQQGFLSGKFCSVKGGIVILFLFCATVFSGNTQMLQAGSSDQKNVPAETTVFQTPPPLKTDEYVSINNFLTALQLVHTTYVDPDKVSYQKLFEAALKGMLKELDPYSSYESPEQYQKIQENNNAKYAGIGITVNHFQGICKVLMVLPGSPAEKAGVIAGDIITSVNDMAVDPDNPVALQNIRGPIGSTVKLTVYRNSQDSMKKFEIVRDSVQFNTVDHVFVCQENPLIGYFHILQFSEKTPEEVDKAMQSLLDQGVKAVIIDLRENPGGLLDSAIKICSQFIPEGKPVVLVSSREENKICPALKDQKYTDIPLALLVNNNSASCAEIMAGCFQDHKRAVIIGTKTFGKASIQTLFPDPRSGTALRITTARYYTPGNQSISEKGIQPDLKVVLPENTRQNVINRLKVAGPAAQATLPESSRDIQYLHAVTVLRSVLLDIKAPGNNIQESPLSGLNQPPGETDKASTEKPVSSGKQQ